MNEQDGRRAIAQILDDEGWGHIQPKNLDLAGEVTLTHDSFEDLDGCYWRELKGGVEYEPHEYGAPARYFDAVQFAGGQPLRTVCVLDLGERRLVFAS